MYFFAYGDKTSDNRPMPGVQIYWEANGEPEYEFISLYLTDRPADQTENDKVWKYFQNLTKYLLLFEIKYEVDEYEDDTIRKQFTIYPNRSRSDMFKVFYMLFEMGFKLLDTSLYQDTKKEFYIKYNIM